MKLKVLAFLSTAGDSALSALWTFPSILASAFLVAWGAEAAQFLISQGLALALLAWLQARVAGGRVALRIDDLPVATTPQAHR